MVEATNWRGRIVSDPDVLIGKPTIKGTRISVELILGWLAVGWTIKQVLDAYPPVTRGDVLAVFAFAADMMRDEKYLAAHKAAQPLPVMSGLLTNENFSMPAIRLLRGRGVDLTQRLMRAACSDSDNCTQLARQKGSAQSPPCIRAGY